ncbi:hypothetical protein CDAR_522331 [Caerostris darwini]|uniref:Uncharacterized protein n=1 Tax=Caerostris darwini TaxID=1538125 RepID=A0AAV4NWL4_9ARAC|nr:hypothetical protein CDAR_522331 [Caerostris darwini]
MLGSYPSEFSEEAELFFDQSTVPDMRKQILRFSSEEKLGEAASAQANCIEDQEECQPDECCIQDGNTSTGVCRKRHVIGKHHSTLSIRN